MQKNNRNRSLDPFDIGYYIFTMLIVSAIACVNNEPDDYQFQLEASYSYPPGPGRQPSIELGSSDEEIDISKIVTSTEINEAGRVNITLSNIKFFDNRSAFTIEDVITEEYRQTTKSYAIDVENRLSFDSSQTNSIILVLDVSLSLGEEVKRVKEYASSFVDTVMEKSVGSTSVGIIGFSTFVEVKPLSRDADRIHEFISSLSEGGNETKLYQAVSAAVEMVAPLDDSDGKAIVIFTDGTNNSCDDSIYCTIEYVEEQLENLQGVSVFVIGLKGKGAIDEAALNRLSVGGEAEFPESAVRLESVFNRYARRVSSLYSFVYDRNDSQLVDPIKLRFTFSATRIQ